MEYEVLKNADALYYYQYTCYEKKFVRLNPDLELEKRMRWLFPIYFDPDDFGNTDVKSRKTINSQ